MTSFLKHNAVIKKKTLVFDKLDGINLLSSLLKRVQKRIHKSDYLFKELKELNEIVDLLDEKTNQDILQAMFEVTGHLGLHGAQIKVYFRV